MNINGVVKWISTGKSILPEHFDNKKGVIKRISQESVKLNLILEDFKRKYLDIAYDLEYKDKDINYEAINSQIKGKNKGDFLAFAYEELREVSQSSSLKHAQKLKYHLDALKKYKANISFDEITFDFLEKHERWLLQTGVKINTASGAMRTIRIFVYRAIKKELITKNPFVNFKIKSQEAKIEYLTKEETVKLHDLYESGILSKRHQTTLHYFLISCYTGLRRSDVSRVNATHLSDNFLSILPQKTKKTGREVRIPLGTRVKRLFLMENIATLKLSISRTNTDIEDILKIIKIKKHITFHCSRHSFAVNSLTLGIPIEVVSSILGHTSLRTTQIYAKVVDELKVSEMKKWDF